MPNLFSRNSRRINQDDQYDFRPQPESEYIISQIYLVLLILLLMLLQSLI